MKLLFASHNKGKILEAKKILAGYEIITPDDDYDILENATTLKGNAFLKANFYYKRYKQPVFADDTGLIVSALAGAPGVYSARFAGLDATDFDNNRLLLEKLADKENRDAYFLTVIAYIDESGKDYYFSGRFEGVIAQVPSGKNGFGYDPIFYLPSYQKTVAELSNDIKNDISHRALALRAFHQFLKEKKDATNNN